MTGRRRALVVAIDEYDNLGLRVLRSPSADAEALASALGDPRIGDFTVDVVRNEPAHEVQARIEDLFAEARADDVLLVHFSGHGLKGEAGDLFFAARNTRPDRLASTAVPADFVQRCIRSTASRSVVLLLDCCYGGAFGQGVAVRAGGDVNVLDSFPTGRLGSGRGRAVITASNAMEYAFEGEQLTADNRPQPSIFTSALVEGLTTGDADRDEDGWVSLDELYDYVFDVVRSRNPHQTPTRDIQMQGDFLVARSGRRRIAPAPVPPDLKAALEDVNPYARLGAVAELRARLISENLPVASSAREALAQVAATDTRLVADVATQALGEVTLSVSPEGLDFGASVVGRASPAQRLELGGPPLARAAAVSVSDPWIRIQERQGGGYDVTVTPPGEGAASGALIFRAVDADVTVPVAVHGVPASAADSSAEASSPAVSSAEASSPAVSSPMVASIADQSARTTPILPGSAPRNAPDGTSSGGAVRPATRGSGWLAIAGGGALVLTVVIGFATGGWPLLTSLAQLAGTWALVTVLAPAAVALVGGIAIVGVRAGADTGRGCVVAGAAAATWLPVFLVSVLPKVDEDQTGVGPVVTYAGIGLLLVAGGLVIATPGVWRTARAGGGLVRNRPAVLVVASATIGAFALLVDVLLLAANVGETSADALLPASWWFVVLAVVVPLAALRAGSRGVRSGLLAGWSVAAAGLWATAFGVQVGTAADKTYAWLDVYGLTLLLLLIAAFVSWPGEREPGSA